MARLKIRLGVRQVKNEKCMNEGKLMRKEEITQGEHKHRLVDTGTVHEPRG
jgi:hypothetical protein